MQRVITALLAAGLVIGVRVAATRDIGFPISTLQQGVTSLNVNGMQLFLARQGSVVTAFSPSAQFENDTLVWCPNEGVFVSPRRFELFTVDGRYVDGPALRDMTTYPVRVDGDLQVHVDTKHPIRARTRSAEQISGEVGATYRQARAGRAVSFCLNPVR